MIFVIEDDRAWWPYYRRVLKNRALRFFRDGVAAVAEMNETVPEAVILDILLNGPTGFAILNEMQSYPELARVPVIVVSGVGLPREDAEVLRRDYGVQRAFDKAKMTPQELAESVAEAVEAGGDEADGGEAVADGGEA